MTQAVATPAPFSLSPGQRESDAWRALKRHLSEQRDELRRSNDKQDLSERDTAFLRGRIRELTRLIDLDKPYPLAPPGP